MFVWVALRVTVGKSGGVMDLLSWEEWERGRSLSVKISILDI